MREEPFGGNNLHLATKVCVQVFTIVQDIYRILGARCWSDFPVGGSEKLKVFGGDAWRQILELVKGCAVRNSQKSKVYRGAG